MTFIAALRLDRISAPWIIDGPINGEFFTIYAEQVLAPTLVRADQAPPAASHLRQRSPLNYQIPEMLGNAARCYESVANAALRPKKERPPDCESDGLRASRVLGTRGNNQAYLGQFAPTLQA
jgi:hypothetical protein